MHIAEVSVRRPVATLMFYGAVLLLGAVSLTRLPVDLLPSIHYPKLAVWTEYPDASPEEVETFVTIPLEGAISSIARIKNISSISREGISLITLEFLWGADMDATIFNLREKLDQLALSSTIKNLSRPTIIRIDPASQPIMLCAISGDNLVSVRETAEAVFKRRLEQIKGVAIAEIHGGVEREIHVIVNKNILDDLRISIQEVSQALGQANFNLTGGSIRQGRFKLSLRTIGEFERIDDLSDVVVKRLPNGRIIKIKDVAGVEDGFKERDAITRSGTDECIGISIYKEAGSNTVFVTNEVNRVLGALRAEYPGLHINAIYEEAGYINESIDNVLAAVWQGGVLAFFVLLLFISGIKNPVNIGIAIPLSILAAFSCLYFAGISLNLMSLGGLALGVGMLVDNSIVVLENIHRRRELGESLRQASVNGAKEVAMAVSASTFTTIAVFIPVIFVEGAAGQLFKQQALTMAFSLLASLVVSLTLLPMLSAHFLSSEYLPGAARVPKSRDSLFQAAFRKFVIAYEGLLRFCLARRIIVLACFLLITALTLIPYSLLRVELFPQIDQRQFYVDYSLPEGSTLESADAVSLALNEWLREVDGIDAVFSSIGIVREKNMASFNMKLNQGSVLIKLKKGSIGTAELINLLKDKLDAMNGVAYEFKTGENVLSKYLAGSEWDLAVRITGESYDVMKTLNGQMIGILRRIKGVEYLHSTLSEGSPEIKLSIKREAANLYGLNVRDVASNIASYLTGDISTRLKMTDRDIDIRVKPGLKNKAELNEILNLNLLSKGTLIPLRDIVDEQYVSGPAEFVRENQMRMIALFVRVADRSPSEVLNDIRREIETISVPQRYRIIAGNANEESAKLLASIITAIIISAALVYMIMSAQFESLLHPFAIMFSLPMGMIGSILLMYLANQSINVMSGIGMIILMGIAEDNAIVLIDFVNHNRRSGRSLNDAVITAGLTRLRPILMTTLTTVFGLLPMVITTGAASELRKPLAFTLMGGLMTSTLLTLLIIPIIYTLLEDLKSFLFKMR